MVLQAVMYVDWTSWAAAPAAVVGGYTAIYRKRMARLPHLTPEVLTLIHDYLLLKQEKP